MQNRIRGIYDALTATLEVAWLPLTLGLLAVVVITRSV